MTDTTAFAAAPVVVVDEGRRRHTRSASDLLRLLVAGGAAMTIVLLAGALDDVGVGIAIDAVDAFEALQKPIVVTLILTVQLLAWPLPLAVIALLVWQRRYRRLMLTVLAAGLAALATRYAESWVIDRFRPEELSIAVPEWICSAFERSAGLSPGALLDRPLEAIGGLASFACVPGDGFPDLVYIAGFASGLSVLSPWIDRRWRRASWLALALFVVVRTIDGIVPPLEAMFVVAAAYALGAATLLVFGGPDRRPTGADIADALAHRGIDLVEIRAMPGRSNDSSRYVATKDDGSRLVVDVLSPDERATSILSRASRLVRLEDPGGVRSLASLRSAVEHEAALSLTAWADGVRTPRVEAAASVAGNSMVLAFEAVEGTSLESLEDASLTDALIEATWAQVAVLRRHRLAHRDLRLANVIVDDEGTPWLVGFGRAELAAGDGRLRGDIAQLMASTAVRVGAERAVAAAVAGMGAAAVADAAPRLQPAALTGDTRRAFERDKRLSAGILDEVKSQTGIDDIEFEQLVRVRRSTVLTAVMLGVTFYFLIPQLADVDLEQVAGADWRWLAPAIVASVLTYLGAAFSLIGAVVEPIPFVPALQAQVASSFFNRISPAKIGGIAGNIRFLQKIGVDPTAAIAGVGLSNIAGLAVHAILLVGFLSASRRGTAFPLSFPSDEAVLVGLTVLLVVAGVVMVLPWGRRVFLSGLTDVVGKAFTSIADIAKSPWKVGLLLGGSVVTTAGYIFALWYCLEAFGEGLNFVQVATVYLAATAVAQAAPTPGGIGATEAALIAGLTAFGVDTTVAVPGVFLYRLVTFWLPVVPGWLAYRGLVRQGAL